MQPEPQLDPHGDLAKATPMPVEALPAPRLPSVPRLAPVITYPAIDPAAGYDDARDVVEVVASLASLTAGLLDGPVLDDLAALVPLAVALPRAVAGAPLAWAWYRTKATPADVRRLAEHFAARFDLSHDRAEELVERSFRLAGLLADLVLDFFDL